MKKSCLFVMVAALAVATRMRAGDISGTVTLKGTPPAEKEFEKKSDPNCGSAKGTTHHYVVGANGALANCVVSLRGGSISGTSKGASASPAVLDQKTCEYSPVIMAVQTGQKVMVKNSDQTLHNVHIVPGPGGNDEKNMAQGPNAPDLPYTPTKPESFLMFKCDVHNWMYAWVSVFDHPYFAVTDKDGKFTIKDVPDGKYTLVVMHRKAAPVSAPVTKEVEVKGGNITEDFTLEAK
jgi:plastocyanin